MSQWARENPDLMWEIAQLPPHQQNAALRAAQPLPDWLDGDAQDVHRADEEHDPDDDGMDGRTWEMWG